MDAVGTPIDSIDLDTHSLRARIRYIDVFSLDIRRTVI
jgi:hypothetical protein